MTVPIRDHSDVHLINVIAVAAGVWFIISPAAFGLTPWDAFEWNNVICGVIVIAAGIAGIVRRHCMPLPIRRIIGVIGGWILLSPWIFGYADDLDRLLNTVAVGAVLIFAVVRCAPART